MPFAICQSISVFTFLKFSEPWTEKEKFSEGYDSFFIIKIPYPRPPPLLANANSKSKATLEFSTWVHNTTFMISRASPLSRKYHSASSQARLNACRVLPPWSTPRPPSLSFFSLWSSYRPASVQLKMQSIGRTLRIVRSCFNKEPSWNKKDAEELFIDWQKKVIYIW
jgi:hypothetical protein